MQGLIHLGVIIAGALALYGTDLTSSSMFYGGVLPLIDIGFLTYLAVIIMHFFVKREKAAISSAYVDLGSSMESGDTACNGFVGDTDCSSGA